MGMALLITHRELRSSGGTRTRGSRTKIFEGLYFGIKVPQIQVGSWWIKLVEMVILLGRVDWIVCVRWYVGRLNIEFLVSLIRRLISLLSFPVLFLPVSFGPPVTPPYVGWRALALSGGYTLLLGCSRCLELSPHRCWQWGLTFLLQILPQGATLLRGPTDNYQELLSRTSSAQGEQWIPFKRLSPCLRIDGILPQGPHSLWRHRSC